MPPSPALKNLGSPPDDPARPLFESEGLEERLRSMRLDAELEAFVRTMAVHGGAKIDLGMEGRLLCERAVAETEPYFEDPAVNRVQDAWRRSRAVRSLSSHPKVDRFLRAAFGRKPFPFQTLNFRRGSEQAFHADTVHFSSVPERFMCGLWIALEDVELDSGPLAYRPGSHRLPILSMQDAGVNSSIPSEDDYGRYYLGELARRLDAAKLPTEQLLLKKGEAFVWAANLAHGGAAIADPHSTRRSLVVHYYFERCLYYTPLFSNPAQGLYHVRLPPNARTGLWVWPRWRGRRVPVGQQMIREALSLFRRRVVHKL